MCGVSGLAYEAGMLGAAKTQDGLAAPKEPVQPVSFTIIAGMRGSHSNEEIWWLLYNTRPTQAAWLKICSTELTEVTKNNKNKIACILKTVHCRVCIFACSYIGRHKS